MMHLSLSHLHTQQRNAFTLVELAIVLVLIGLLAGGVLAGRDLIKAATLQSQVKQLQDFDTAMAAFLVKYNCTPGDCKMTSAYWPDLANGDGDGNIESELQSYYDASPGARWANSPEYRNFFISLGRAGYITDDVDAALPGSGIPVPGKQIPALKLNKTAGMFASDTQSFTVLTGVSRNPTIDTLRKGTNALWMVACAMTDTRVWGWDDNCGIFKALDLQSIDSKIDDGAPLRGKFFGFGGADSQNDCLNVSGTLAESTYKLTKDTPQCQAAYILN